MNNTTRVRFRRPVLAFLGAALLVLFGMIFFGIFQYEKNENEREMQHQFSSIDSLFTYYLEQDKKVLEAFLEIIQSDKTLQQAYLSGSRDALFKAASPLFSRLLDGYDISHYYFVKPDRTCFLRVHNPDNYGDFIDRFTMQQAALSGKPSYGIELGVFGTFTLRVVHPWIIDNTLVGFVELGREIDYISPELKKILGVELFFLVNKELLSRENWQEGLRIRGKRGSWDELPRHVIVDRTVPGFPEMISAEGSFPADIKTFNVSLAGKNYEGGRIPLLDSSGRTVGDIVFLADSTEKDAEGKRILFMMFVSVIVCGAGFFFFYGYMGRLQGGLQKAYSGLETEIESRKRIEKELRDYEEHLEQQVTTRTAKIQESKDSLLQEMRGRKEAEEKVIQAHDEWEKSFNAIEDIITIQDADMNIIRANKAANVFFAEEMESVCGRKWYELFGENAISCPDCPATMSNLDKGCHTEIFKVVRFGRIFTVTSAPVFDAEGELQYLVHVARDITQQKKLEEDLAQAQKMEAIGTLAGGIAHDFNNILSAILGYSELAKQHLPPGTAAQDDIDQVISAGQRAGNLVKQILDVSRKTQQSLQPLQPHLIVLEALQLLRSTLPTTVEIESDIDPASGTILADSTKIHQIVMNLCTNGFHALKEEKGTLRVTLSRQERAVEDSAEESRQPLPYVVLSVIDTGQGMATVTAARIFEPYFTTKEMGKGSGLGLAVVHGIIESYKGFIEVESEPGHGTTVRVFIPALEEDISIPEKSKKVESLPLGTERILVVDDEPLLVRISQRLLENYGYTVTGVTDSREALAIVQADPTSFDLIISDQTMPGLTGSELARAVLEIAPAMPIIICTGHSAIVSAEEAYVMGIRKYLCKPVEGDTLARTVRMVLDEQQGNRDA